MRNTNVHNMEKIVLVQDNPTTHKPASLYEAFAPAEARRLVERFEWHFHPPQHGSWLDMAESEPGVLVSRCLDRRIADKQVLIVEVDAWQTARTAEERRGGNSRPQTHRSSRRATLRY